MDAYGAPPEQSAADELFCVNTTRHLITHRDTGDSLVVKDSEIRLSEN